ncbi:MAG: hypothetical protein ABJA78_17295 [Ferruginibacter sp.]
MKRKLSLLLFFSFNFFAALAQGKFAGSLIKMIGVKYTNDRHIKGLEGFTYREGSIASPLEDEQLFSVSVYKKGTTSVVLFSLSETDKKTFQVLDLLEIKNVTAGQDIKTMVCRENKIDNIEIVTLVKYSRSEYLKNVLKAWRFNRDKIRFETIPVKGIDCLNEGFGE